MLRPRATSNPIGLRKASPSRALVQLSSEKSCPLIAVPGSLENEKMQGNLKATSASFIKRKSDLQAVGLRRAHGQDNCPQIGHSNLLPPGSVPIGTLRPTNLEAPPTEVSHGSDLGEDLLRTSPSPSVHSLKSSMPKSPQLSFRSPSSAPRMLPPHTEAPAFRAIALSSPQISFSTSVDSAYDYGPLPSTQTATVTAVLEPHRRSPPPENRPVLCVAQSTEDEHVLSVRLPGFTPEMVTVSARKDDKLAVVADLWHAETNCHHEWLVAFAARDVNVSLTRAHFSPDGLLTIHVPRHNTNFFWTRSRLR
ncbi:hypothetical protein M0805_007669 [Coniferiporia weirii]|nr:hypothetical protein M0805_007669 [Coniferiporia weirii]